MFITLDQSYEVKCTLGTIRDVEKVFNKSFFTLVKDIQSLRTDDQIKLIYIGVKRANPDLTESKFLSLCEDYLGIGDLMELLEKYLYALQYPGLSEEEVQSKVSKKLQQAKENQSLIGKA